MLKFSFYVGIDLGNAKHAICVLDRNRVAVCQRVVEDHQVLDVIAKAIGDAPPGDVAVAVEDRNNVVVEALLDVGFAVHSINPKQADLFRGRMTASGAKDDKRDAFVLARALMSDPECFRVLEKRTADDERLRTGNRILEQLDDDHRRAANQLRAAVLRFFPALLSLCEGADAPWFWELVLLLKDVEHARRVRPSTMDALLRKHRKKNVVTADIVAILQRPLLKPSASTGEAALQQARALIERLRLVEKQRRAFVAKRQALLTELAKPAADGSISDVAILLTLPGVGPMVVSTMLAEGGPLLRRGELALLRALAGVAPVTTRSGRSTRVSMRQACNPRLRDAMHHAAFAAGIHDEQFRADRTRHQANGHESARACRSLGDKLLGIAVAMLKDRTLYGAPKKAPPAPASAA